MHFEFLFKKKALEKSWDLNLYDSRKSRKKI